jgi:hypothetical protein
MATAKNGNAVFAQKLTVKKFKFYTILRKLKQGQNNYTRINTKQVFVHKLNNVHS